jgi:hypothetical protein
MMKRLVFSMVGLSLLLFGNVGQVEALQFDLTDEVKLDFDVELKYTGAWRMKDQDKKLLGLNNDDGNRSFDKHDMIYNKYSVMADFDLQYKNIGLFARPRAFYDNAYDSDNANRSLTNNNLSMYGGSLSSSDQFSSETKDRHRDTTEILDLYGYGQFELGEEAYLDLRVGRQVVSWGESLYVQNSVSSAMLPLDATASVAPGTALKEIFLPVEQVYAQLDIGNGASFSGYYQWEWDKSRIAEQGSYFSSSDTIDSAGERALTGIPGFDDLAFEKTGDENPKDDGQFGLAFRYRAEALNDTEFGFYYANYHDKYPIVKFEGSGGTPSPTAQALGAAPVQAPVPPTYNPADPFYSSIVGGYGNMPVAPVNIPGTTIPIGYVPMGALEAGPASYMGAFELNYVDLSSYHLEYVENIQMVGTSFGTRIGDTNVGGELTYRSGIPIEIEDSNPSNLLGFDYEEGDAVQIQVSAIHSYGVTSFWDQLMLKGEVGFNHVMGFGGATLTADQDAWGGTAVAEASYYQVLKGLDMTASINYSFNPNGTSSLSASFEEDANDIAYGLDFVYLFDYRFGVQYVDFMGDAEDNDMSDRDYLAVHFKYTF